jgi:hypothetical protein
MTTFQTLPTELQHDQTDPELSAQLNGCASPFWTALFRETTAAIVPATVMKSETPMRIRQSTTPIHHFKPRSDAGRVLRDSYIHMIAGIVLPSAKPKQCDFRVVTYTASGVPHRALISVKRSSKTGIAREKIKTRTPVPTTHELDRQLDTGVGHSRPSCPMLPGTFGQMAGVS